MAWATKRLYDWRRDRLVPSAQATRVFVFRLLLILAAGIMLGSLLQACGGGGGGPVTSLKSLTIEPVNSSIAVGTKVQLRATGTFKNKTTKDLTDSVTWSSADTGVANVSNAAGSKGLTTGGGAGATTIVVKFKGKKGVSTFTATQATLKSITVEPVNPSVAKGTTVQMSALGNFSDGSVQDLTTQVSWSSANSSIARVSNASSTQGLVTAASVGNTPIVATFNGVQGSTMVTVTAATLTSIAITVPATSIAKGTTVQLTATCNFSDGTTQDCTNQVSWTSGNSGVAQVSDTAPSKGLVTGVGVGNTTISGSLGGIQGSATATVTDATLSSITIAPPGPSIAKGTMVELTATGNFSDGTTQDLTTQVSWTSGDDTIAQVSNISETEGLVTGLSAGNTSITATLNGIEGSTTIAVTAATLTSITVTPPILSVPRITTVPLTAICNFSDMTTQDCTSQVSWTSADETIAQVSNVLGSEGLVTGLGVGATSITATLNGIGSSAAVTVSAATLTSITVTPPGPSIPKITTVPLTATCNFSDNTTQDCTTQVSWTSANEAIAHVSNISGSEGQVTALAEGSSLITATLNGIGGSTTVTVSAAILTSITVTPPGPSIPKITTVPLTATCNFSDNTTQDCTTQVSWTSASDTIAPVSNTSGSEGRVTGLVEGSSLITATATPSGIHGSTTVTVSPAILQAITVAPQDQSLAKGHSLKLTATCIFSDLTTQDCTSQVSWTSGNDGIAVVSNASGSQGLVTGQSVGGTSITATLGVIFGSTTVNVSPATLSSIAVTPAGQSIAKGTSLQLIATGTFSDGSTLDLTASASWISTDTTVATVGNTSTLLGPGKVQGVGIGNGVTITATQAGISGSTTVNVTAATLSSIAVTPADQSIAKGTILQLIATGTFSDGSTKDLTASASWISADTTIATVGNTSNLLGPGKVQGVGIGNGITITATQAGISGSTTVNVTAAIVTQIIVTPANPSVSSQGTEKLQMTATAVFSDGTMQVVTQQANWTSSDDTVAHIISSSSTETNGELQAKKPGTTTITATIPTLGGAQGSTLATVT